MIVAGQQVLAGMLSRIDLEQLGTPAIRVAEFELVAALDSNGGYLESLAGTSVAELGLESKATSWQ